MGRAKTDMRTQPLTRAVVLGESTAWGYSASSKDACWANLLVGMLAEFQGSGIELINQAIGSNVLTPQCPAYERSARPSALERLDAEVIDLAPDLLLLSYGLNDSRGGTPVEIFRREYQGLIDRVRTRLEPLIVLVNTYYMLRYDSPGWDHADLNVTELYNLAIRQLADDNDLILADVFAAEDRADWLIDPDRVHPNDLGHRLIANRVFEAVACNCSFVSRNMPKSESLIGPFVRRYRNGPQQPVISQATVDFNYHLYQEQQQKKEKSKKDGPPQVRPGPADSPETGN